jgi:opacity protein-like surface antigen
MIGKFGAVALCGRALCERVLCRRFDVRLVLAMAFFGMLLTGAATVHAQQTSTPPPPAQQAPTTKHSDQQSGTQEASPEETMRRVKPKNYKNWNFNVGGGASLTNGTTQKFVRGGGGIAAAGVARNYSQYFGLRADFQFDNLPLRQSALEAAQAPGASSQVYSFMVGPVINIPVTKEWGGYLVFGPGFYHRSGKLDSSTALPGSSCNAFFTWWGNCSDNSLPLDKSFLSASQNEFGYNFGGGITHKVHKDIEIYAEFRYLHGTHDSKTTDLRPITIGVRW